MMRSETMNNPTDTNQASEDEKLARLFHDTYERLAPAFSYKTRKASAVPWADVPPNNKGLMIAVAHAVNDSIRTEKLKLLAEVRERVVDKPTGNHNADSLLERDVLIYNQATAYLRTELAKLEAEL